MTPLDRAEACYRDLVAHYDEGDNAHVRAATKMLMVSIERLQRHGGADWAEVAEDYLRIARDDPERFLRILKANRGGSGRSRG